MASPTSPTHEPPSSTSPEENEEALFPNPLNPSAVLRRSETITTFLSHQHLSHQHLSHQHLSHQHLSHQHLSHQHLSLIFPAPLLSALPTHEIEKMLHIFIACGMLSPTTSDEKNPTPEFKSWAEALLKKFMRASGKVSEALLARADLQTLQVSVFLATEAAAGKAEAGAGKEGEGSLYKTIRDGTAKEEREGTENGEVVAGEVVRDDEEVSEVVLGKLGWGLRFILGMVVFCAGAGERMEIEYLGK